MMERLRTAMAEMEALTQILEGGEGSRIEGARPRTSYRREPPAGEALTCQAPPQGWARSRSPSEVARLQQGDAFKQQTLRNTGTRRRGTTRPR